MGAEGTEDAAMTEADGWKARRMTWSSNTISSGLSSTSSPPAPAAAAFSTCISLPCVRRRGGGVEPGGHVTISEANVNVLPKCISGGALTYGRS